MAKQNAAQRGKGDSHGREQESSTQAAYSILDRGEGKEVYWHLIGTAFVCKDGSLNLVLNSLPLDGKVHIRDFKERDAQ